MQNLNEFELPTIEGKKIDKNVQVTVYDKEICEDYKDNVYLIHLGRHVQVLFHKNSNSVKVLVKGKEIDYRLLVDKGNSLSVLDMEIQ